ncbi:hypothetical protein E2C01_034548 [Portunus trituberculatus]|uniref:Uncharacterized protein n=1 Tax=Portunus trituberculatus TaxID=210409 RepID=A0A5B7F1V7_PORTR|nr:hypothetical protein [Portunus trituberculatus]
MPFDYGREHTSHSVVATAWRFGMVCWEHTNHSVVATAWCFAVARFLRHAPSPSRPQPPVGILEEYTWEALLGRFHTKVAHRTWQVASGKWQAT